MLWNYTATMYHTALLFAVEADTQVEADEAADTIYPACEGWDVHRANHGVASEPSRIYHRFSLTDNPGDR